MSKLPHEPTVVSFSFYSRCEQSVYIVNADDTLGDWQGGHWPRITQYTQSVIYSNGISSEKLLTLGLRGMVSIAYESSRLSMLPVELMHICCYFLFAC